MRRRPLCRLILSLALVAGAASAPLVSALAGPAEDKATARELAKQGIELETKGDCHAAVDKLERAESLFHAPPHLQHLGRCYAKLGRLVDATEAFRKLTLEVLPPNAPDVFKAAVAEANAELPKLEPRLAHLTIKPAESYAGLEVAVDGKGWPSAALDVSRVIDPGKHEISAKAAGRKPQTTSVTLPEGGTDTVELKLEAGAGPAPTGSTTTVPTTTATTTATTPGPQASPLRTVGLVVAGVGAAAMIGGGVTGLLGQSKYADLEKACPGQKCQASYDLDGQKRSIHGLETLTNVFLIGGGLLLVGGVTTYLLAPKSAPAVGLVVAPTAAGLQFGLSGHF